MGLENWSIAIGEVVAPFGISGEAKVRIDTDFPERFAELERVCLRMPDGSAHLYDVDSARLHKSQALLKLRGVDSIEAVDRIRGAVALVTREEAVSLDAGEYYIHDLVGCEVVTAEGARLGTLTDVIRNPANDVYVIGEGKSEILLPALKSVVRSVDIAGRLIVVTPTPGLLPGEAVVV